MYTFTLYFKKHIMYQFPDIDSGVYFEDEKVSWPAEGLHIVIGHPGWLVMIGLFSS